MQTSRHLEHARQVAMEAHDGQQDKIREPYFQHCQRVADLVSTDEEKTVAYLHDVAEKAFGWTISQAFGAQQRRASRLTFQTQAFRRFDLSWAQRKELIAIGGESVKTDGLDVSFMPVSDRF